MTNLKSGKTIPPELARKILLRFLRDDLAEEVLGDLNEKFYLVLKNKSLLKAKLNYWYQVFNYLRPFAIRKSKPGFLNHYDMFENYFKIGWRILSKQKMYSSIKIGGFAIGIAACILIALFIRQELSYDLHYTNGDRIYRIVRISTFRGDEGKGVHFPAPFAGVLQEEYPEFEKVGQCVQNFGGGGNEVRRADSPESTHEEGFAFIDQGLLEILELPFVYGSPKQALTEPNTIVITKRKAEQYFPNEDPIGKLFILNNDAKRLYKVTGVIENFPVTSHIQYDFLMSLPVNGFWPGQLNDWRSSNNIEYVLVRPGADIAQLEKKLSLVLNKYFLPGAVKGGGNTEEINWVKSIRFKLQPVRNIYLNQEGVGDNLSHGDMRYIWLFGAIATFTLLIACVNFVNLSTAKSANRAREVGLRKVVGSHRSSLIKQFLTESLLFSYFSFVLGFGLAWLFLPHFNKLLAKSLIFPWDEWWLFPVLSGAALIIGIIAGLYPSFYLSSFRPAQVLKGNLSRGSKNSTIQSVLVVFQFVVSIILIAGTFVINRQMNYILTKKLGFDKNQVVVLEGTHTLNENIVAFKNEILRLANVKHVSISGYIPVVGDRRNGGRVWKDGMKETEQAGSQFWPVDHDYVKTMGLKIIKGRDFSIELASDSQAVIINESLARVLNMNDPIGQNLYNWQGRWNIIGVVEDFHFESLKQNIEPFSLMIGRSSNSVLVKVNTSDMPGMIGSISKVWKQFSPNQPIRFTFLDQSYAQVYDDVKRIGIIFTTFSILAIIVACLGLFALSAFMVEQRSKEISIRLVLGASVKSIFSLLTMNFLKLVVISLIIAVPISMVLMQEWLKDFAYKIEISWEVFALAGLMLVVLALVTISYQSLKAALMNPVDSLKSE